MRVLDVCNKQEEDQYSLIQQSGTLEKTYREEEVRDIVGDVDSNTHVGEMEPVAKADES